MQLIESKEKSIKYSLFIFLFLFVLLAPFSLRNSRDGVTPQKINDSSVGYYQSTTCNLSLFEVIFKNLGNNNKIYINNNDYVGIECYGKVTGLDKVNDTYFLSIGTNVTLTFIIQSFIWIFLLFLFSKKRENKNKISYIPIFIIPFIFTTQHITESRFYENSNKYFDNSLDISNYYLLGYFMAYLLISLLLKDIYESRSINIIYLIPFMYLFHGTFTGMNLNIYLLFFSFYGIQRVVLKKTKKEFNLVFILFSIIWIINKQETINFFNGDKLRGFINSSNSLYSTIFWIVIFYLLVNGIIFLISEIKNKIDLKKLKNSFLISGSLITILGVFGSMFPLFNFFNFLIFGQNKRGMKSLASVDGNTWRGFASSAEFIGEFYALCLLFTIYFYIKNYKRINLPDLLMVLLCIFGLYKTNNFAAISSLFVFSLILLLNNKYNFSLNRQSMIIIFGVLLIFGGFLLQLGDYEYNSSLLIEEGILHSELFLYSDNWINFLKKDKFFKERDYKSLFTVEGNETRASSSLLLIVDLYTTENNIPLLPNIVATISTLSIFINRTELWGIFVAKYNPSMTEAAFGYGPFQLSNYLFDHNVRLDIPTFKFGSLFLPHSSLLDFILFFGFFGFIIFLFFCLRNIYFGSYSKNIFSYLFIFLILNILKSDSMLYIPTFTMFIFLFYKTFLDKESSNNG